MQLKLVAKPQAQSFVIPKEVGEALEKNELRALQVFLSFRNQIRPVQAIISSGLDDFDDWQALFSIVSLAKMGFLKPLLFVVGLEGSLPRSRAIKGVLKLMGLGDIPVAKGSDRTPRPEVETQYLINADRRFLADESEIISDAQGRMSWILQNLARPKDKATFIGLASFTDFADFAKNYPKLFREKVEHVALMSGVEQNNEQLDTQLLNIRLNRQRLMPNTIAMNNCFDMESTKRLFQLVQNYTNLSVVTRQAAYATSFSVDVIDTLTVLGFHDDVAKFAADIAQRLLQKFWEDAVDGTGPRSKRWFENAFNYGKAFFEGENLSLNQLKLKPMIRYVSRLVPYDTLTVLAALDTPLRQHIFEPLTIAPSAHRLQSIIGLSAQSNGLNPSSSIDLPSLLGALTKYPSLERLYLQGKL